MKTLNFWRTLLFTVVAAAAFTACSDEKDEQPNGGAPSITVNGGPTANIGVTLEGIEKTEAIAVVSSGKWTLTYSDGASAWVTPSATSGSGKSSLTFKIAANTEPREATITLTTTGSVAGFPISKSATIVIKQSKGGSSGEAIYSNNFDVSKVEKVDDRWPFLDQTEVWKNATGTGNSTVTYEYTNVSVRSSGKLSGGYPGASGVNKIFFGTAPATFSIDKITLPAGAKDFKLVFGGAYSKQNGTDYDNIFKPESFNVTLGNGTGWSGNVTYTKIGGGDTVDPFWVYFEANFTLPEAISELSVKFTANLSSGFAIDDVLLSEGDGGQEISFAGGPGPGGEEVAITIPELINGMPTEQTVIDATNDRSFEAIVVTDKAGGNWNKNTLMVMTPGATTEGNGLALFGSGQYTNPEDAGFTFAKGDKVKVVLKAGKARRINFKGLYEITGDAAGGWVEITKISGGNAIAPVTIGVDKLAAFQGMLVKVENAKAPATAAIWCASDKFGVNVFTVGGTNMNVFCQANMPGLVDQMFSANATGSIVGFPFVKDNASQICPQSPADVAPFMGAPSTDPKITVSPASLSFAAAGETKPVTVTAVNADNCTLTVSSDNSQFTAVASGLTSVSVVAAQNTTAAVISGVLTIKLMKSGAAVDTKTVTLSQAAPMSGAGYTKIDNAANLSAGSYYMAGFSESYTNSGTTTTFAPYSYHVWTGELKTVSGSTDCATVGYEFTSANALVVNPAATGAGAMITLESAGAADTYYIKVGTKYLSATGVKRALALVDAPQTWTFSAAAKGGILAATTIPAGTVNMGTAGAKSDMIRAYAAPALSLVYGVCFFKAN